MYHAGCSALSDGARPGKTRLPIISSFPLSQALQEGILHGCLICCAELALPHNLQRTRLAKRAFIH